jgi:hypothetical protein
MKTQHIPLYVSLIASAAPLVAADQKPTNEKPPITFIQVSETYVFGTLEQNSETSQPSDWQWGQDTEPDPEIVQQIANRAGQPVIKFPVENIAANIAVGRQWGKGADTNPELVQDALNRGVQKGFTVLPLESNGPTQSWADIKMATPAQEQTTQEIRPFVWNEGKMPSKAIIDQFDAQAKKGPQRGVASLPCEPSSSDQ